MDGLARMFSPAIALDGPFGRFKRVLDVGGSRGHTLALILRQYPRVSAVLADLPPVIAGARPRWSAGGEYEDVADRCTAPPPPPPPPGPECCHHRVTSRMAHPFPRQTLHRRTGAPSGTQFGVTRSSVEKVENC